MAGNVATTTLLYLQRGFTSSCVYLYMYIFVNGSKHVHAKGQDKGHVWTSNNMVSWLGSTSGQTE